MPFVERARSLPASTAVVLPSGVRVTSGGLLARFHPPDQAPKQSVVLAQARRDAEADALCVCELPHPDPMLSRGEKTLDVEALPDQNGGGR